MRILYDLASFSRVFPWQNNALFPSQSSVSLLSERGSSPLSNEVGGAEREKEKPKRHASHNGAKRTDYLHILIC